MQDNFKKLPIYFDLQALRDAYEYAVTEIGFSGDLVNCISLVKREDASVEERGIFWTKDDDYNEVQIEKSVDEEAYRVFEPKLKETYFKNVYDTLSKHYRIGRVRVLKLNPRTSLSYHRDPENRIHIPIVTNPGALMIVNNEAYHMEADGSTYYMHTLAYHSAFNGGSSPRIHLVATILDENPDDELYAVYGGE